MDWESSSLRSLLDHERNIKEKRNTRKYPFYHLVRRDREREKERVSLFHCFIDISIFFLIFPLTSKRDSKKATWGSFHFLVSLGKRSWLSKRKKGKEREELRELLVQSLRVRHVGPTNKQLYSTGACHRKKPVPHSAQEGSAIRSELEWNMDRVTWPHAQNLALGQWSELIRPTTSIDFQFLERSRLRFAIHFRLCTLGNEIYAAG